LLFAWLDLRTLRSKTEASQDVLRQIMKRTCLDANRETLHGKLRPRKVLTMMPPSHAPRRPRQSSTASLCNIIPPKKLKSKQSFVGRVHPIVVVEISKLASKFLQRAADENRFRFSRKARVCRSLKAAASAFASKPRCVVERRSLTLTRRVKRLVVRFAKLFFPISEGFEGRFSRRAGAISAANLAYSVSRSLMIVRPGSKLNRRRGNARSSVMKHRSARSRSVIHYAARCSLISCARRGSKSGRASTRRSLTLLSFSSLIPSPPKI